MISFVTITLIGLFISLGIYIVTNGLILVMLTRIFKWTKKNDFKIAYKTSAFMGFVQGLLILIPLFLVPIWGIFGINLITFGLTILFHILIIRYMYSLEFWKSAVFWSIIFCINIAIGFLLSYFLNLIFITLGLNAMFPIHYTF